MPKLKIYVGIKSNNREVFTSEIEPTQQSHGHLYGAVIGAFRTRGAADYMVDHGGHSNPHLQSVADAERLFAEYNADPKEGDYIQLLDRDSNPCENFLLVDIDGYLFKFGEQLYSVTANDGADITITRNPDLDTGERRAWQEVITATPNI